MSHFPGLGSPVSQGGKNRCALAQHMSASWTLCRMGDLARDTREGWPQLTVETEVTGDSKSTIKGVLPTSSRPPPLPPREGRQV